MAAKKSFVVYSDCEQHVLLLSKEERGELFTALFGYAKRGEVPQFDGMLKMAFSFIRAQMDRDTEKYETICHRNRQNGAKGGRPSSSKTEISKPQKPSGLSGNPQKPKKADTDTDTDTDIDTDNDTDKEKDIKECMSEPAVAVPDRQPLISLILNDSSEYPVYQDQVDSWSELYPAVDILQQLRKMKGWCDANPSKRKTKRGILKFINLWLSREQDKGGHIPSSSSKINYEGDADFFDGD